jgi:hypothetical protein
MVMYVENAGEKNVQGIISLLNQDHQKILHLCEQFQSAKKQKDINAKQFLVELACTELVIHAQLEQELIYPGLQASFNETDMIEQAIVEHDITCQLISDLELMEPDEQFYDAKFNVLCEYVRHRIKLEQEHILPRLKEFPLSSEAVMTFINRRENLRSEFGMPDEYGIMPDQHATLPNQPTHLS